MTQLIQQKTKTNVKRVLKKIVSWSGLFFFIVAIYMIYRQLSTYDIKDVRAALHSIPMHNLMLSCFACLLGYVSLAFYDFLALKYIGRSLNCFKWLFAGVIGFAVSNSAGHAVVSGGAIRYRLYTRWRFKALDIVKMVMFSGFTYLFGSFFVIILGYLLMPAEAFDDNPASHATVISTVLMSAGGLIAYLAATVIWHKPVFIKGIRFKLPSFKMAWAQIFVGSMDVFFASLILYFVLIHFIDVPFGVFLGVFVISIVLGVFSQVPGGLGVFEFTFTNLLPGDHNVTEIYGALIMYRIIYYLLPLIVSGLLLVASERRWIKFRSETYCQPHRPKYLTLSGKSAAKKVKKDGKK